MLLVRFFVRMLATGFGSGLSPKAPGTFGSVVGLAAAYLCHLMMLRLAGDGVNAPSLLLFGIVPGALIVALSYLVISFEETWSKAHDSASTVIDEVAGQSLALLWFSPHWSLYLLGFILFRILDIWKPSVIGWADRELHGAWGTLLDDVIAGLVVALMLGILCLCLPNLFI